MRKVHVLLWAFWLITFSLSAQKQLTVEDIYKGKFSTSGMRELHGMKNSNQYTLMNVDPTTK